MKLHHFAIVMCVFTCLMGCQSDPHMASYLEALRSEKLWLEDQYYSLEAHNKQTTERLASTQAENRDLRIRLGMEVSPNEPRVANPELGNPVPNQGSPTIELGTPMEPGSPDRASLSASSEILANYQVDVEEPSDRRVTHIVLDPRFTMGQDFDQRGGDDGISVLIEPRNADDLFVSEPGEVSIVVLDPALREIDPYVGRWEIDWQESQQRMQRNAVHGRGILLRLPWPNGYPKHSKLRLFVRYVTANGEKLQAEAELNISLPGQLSARWTPKSTGDREIGSDVALSQYVSEDESHDVQTPLPSQLRSANGGSVHRPQWSPFRER